MWWCIGFRITVGNIQSSVPILISEVTFSWPLHQIEFMQEGLRYSCTDACIQLQCVFHVWMGGGGRARGCSYLYKG